MHTSDPQFSGQSAEPGLAAPVVLFDGECRLCRATVGFILRHEAPGSVLRFCPLQSPIARVILGLEAADRVPVESVLLAEDGVVLAGSDATLRLAAFLRWPWRWMGALRVLPRRARDRVYDWIALNRIRWFGRPEEPMEALLDRYRDRFL